MSESASLLFPGNSDRHRKRRVDSKIDDAYHTNVHIKPSTHPHYQPQPDFLSDDDYRSSAFSTHRENNLVQSTPHSNKEASLSSSVRTLLARQNWRQTTNTSQLGSGIIGPILLSFDEGDNDNVGTNMKHIESRSLLELDGLDTSYQNCYTGVGAVDTSDTSMKDEYDTSNHERLASSAFAKMQSIFTRRRNFPDPNRAISNLFGIKLNPLAAPNLLDKISTEEGLELLFTSNNSTLLDGSFSDEIRLNDVSNTMHTPKALIDFSIPDRSFQSAASIPSNNLPSDYQMNRVNEAVSKIKPIDDQMNMGTQFDINGCLLAPKVDGHQSSSWSQLSILLSVSYACTSFSGSAAITLLPSIASDLFKTQSSDASVVDASASNFVSVVASYAVFSSALGKFINGPLGDILGARRVSCVYSVLLSLSFMLLSFSQSGNSILLYCSALEFTQSVQWPCMAIILASHYGEAHSSSNGPKYARSNHRYERAVYEVSIGSRVGQLLASFITTLLLHYYMVSWRTICRLVAQISLISCAIIYFFVFDSPTTRHKPQNPIRELNSSSLGSFIFKSPSSYLRAIEWILRVAFMILSRNIFPSVRSVLSSVTFWIIALAHSGGSIILSSGRILGSYFADTSDGNVSVDQAGEFTAFLSLGIFVGLAAGGKAFSNLSSDGRERKKFIRKKYMMSVGMCYILSLLAIPSTRNLLLSSSLVTSLQIVATFLMGAGVAVPLYCIPAIVGANFGANKGLFFSYIDGVAYLVGSMVWGLVAGAVAEGNPQGSGWAYGWAAVAILVILAGWLMVEFVGRYFAHEENLCRRDHEISAPQQLTPLQAAHSNTTDSSGQMS